MALNTTCWAWIAPLCELCSMTAGCSTLPTRWCIALAWLTSLAWILIWWTWTKPRWRRLMLLWWAHFRTEGLFDVWSSWSTWSLAALPQIQCWACGDCGLAFWSCRWPPVFSFPMAIPWKKLLLSIWSDGTGFLSSPGEGLQHVFSDGTCGGIKPFSFAAWGCINATTSVPGLAQTSDRAELHGALGALRWQLYHGVDMMLWLDSKYVADGLDYVLMHGFAGNAWANHDLWRLIEEQIHQLGSLVLTPRWIPSHLDEQTWMRLWGMG